MGSVTLSFTELLTLLAVTAFLTAVPASLVVQVGLAVIERRLGVDIDHRAACRAQDRPNADGDADGSAGGADSADD